MAFAAVLVGAVYVNIAASQPFFGVFMADFVFYVGLGAVAVIGCLYYAPQLIRRRLFRDRTLSPTATAMITAALVGAALLIGAVLPVVLQTALAY